MKKDDYVKLRDENIQTVYKKEVTENVNAVDNAHERVVRNLGLEDRVFETTKRSAFISIKDHKPNFMNDPKVRLLNPCKPELGKVSKQILEKIIAVIRSKSKLTQFKNSDDAISWFKNLKNKKRLRFIQFDICKYYESITLELLENVLEWAKMYVDITNEEKEIIMESKKSFLYAGDTPWVKKGAVNFDNGMGAYDGAECCDIIGLFLLDQLNNRIKEIASVLFRDDGISVSDATPRLLEKARQKIVKIFEEFGLKITSTANLKVIQFLDITLDLENEVFKPYIKPGDRPLYVSSDSNHPPSILKNIPLSINRRLSSISANREIVNAAAPLFQAELDRFGVQE